jgi:hypothetical protein
MGAVVLAITGAEALYADMGHFGARPIRQAWFGFVIPSLIINYFGQGALLLTDPGSVDNPFYHLAPDWALLPLVVLSTAATVIASQAVISGAFSVTRQAMQLGFVPRFEVKYTSEREQGQIYLPGVNWGLFLAVVILVLGFQSTNNLAGAYGIAVTGDFIFTSKLVDGRFPDYRRVLPKNPDKHLEAGCDLLKQAFARAAILSNEKFRGVRLYVSENQLKITANNPEQEEAEEILDVTYAGTEMEIGFNVSYVLDVLNALKCENVRILLTDSVSSVQIEDAASQSAAYVVMPMRL